MSSVPPPRSGGKIVSSRRPTLPRTPYDRPPPRFIPNSEENGNPNWISRLILSPTRMIAGKVFSTVFGPDSPSDSDEDSSSEDGMNDDSDVSSQGADAGKMSTMIASSSKEPQPTEWKSETKRVIERLLMQESFSREECDRLTYIIKSRVVDSTAQGTIDDAKLTVGNDADTDIRSTAIFQAKKWIEEKKLGSSSKPELDYGTCSLNTAMMPHDAEDPGGSPIDLAKSYMRERPQWASSSISPIEFKSPSPKKGIPSSQEGTPYFFSPTSASSSKLNQDSPATGSWNITEELRRVRLKAAEDMLRTPSSSRIDWSSLTSRYKRSPNPFTIGKMEAVVKDKSLTSTQDAPLNLKGEATANDLADGQQTEADGLYNATFLPLDQDMVDINEGQAGMVRHGQRSEISEGLKVASQSYAGGIADDYEVDRTNHISGSLVGETYHEMGTYEPVNHPDALQDSRPHQNNCSVSKDATKDIAGMDGAFAANGVPSSASSQSAGRGRVENSTSSAEEHGPAGSDHDKMNNAKPSETCNLLSEASVEVPVLVLEEADIIVSALQDSSSMNHKESLQDLTRPKLRSKPAGKAGGNQEQQERKVSSRYTRRGRGRGK